MKKPETTSPRVAKIAGRMLRTIDRSMKPYGLDDSGGVFIIAGAVRFGTVKELKAVLASCLTQAPDKPKAKRRD